MKTDLTQRAAAAATPDLVADWQRDGAVCLRQLLNADELAQLRRGIDANLAAPSPRAIVASQPDDPGPFIEDFCNWQHNPDFPGLANVLPAGAPMDHPLLPLLVERAG